MTEANQVWVIDDDRSIRWVLEKALTKAGMQVTSFSSANGVMEALERGQPEVVLSDVRMPNLSGQQLFERVSVEHPEMARRFVFATGDLAREETMQFLEQVPNRILYKPLEVETLRRVLTQVIASNSRRESRSTPSV